MTPTPHENSPNHAADDLGPLIELLEIQHGLMDELARLAEQQRVLVDEARSDALLTLLSRRQHIVERFTASQTELTDLTQDLDARLEAVDEDRRTRIRSLLDAIGTRLSDVMIRDAADQRTLMGRRAETQREIEGQGQARQARRAYLGRHAPGARFSDRQG